MVEGWDDDVEVRECVSDTLGYLWISTDKGIWRYDGSRLESFEQELRSLDIRSLIYTSDHRLLLCNDEGIININPYSQSPKFTLEMNMRKFARNRFMTYPNHLYEDSKDRIWILGLDGHVGMLDGDHLQMIAFNDLCDIDFSKLKIVESEGEFLLLGGHDCIYKIDRLFNPVEVEIEGDLSEMYDFIELDDGLYFFGKGIQKATLLHNAELIILNDILTTDIEILSICEDATNTVFAGTKDHGLLKVDLTNGKGELKKVFMSNDPHRVNELPFENVSAIYSNDEGLWLSSDIGLSLLQRRYFEMINTLPNLNTTVVYHDIDATYVGMGGLYRITNQADEWQAELTDMGSNFSVNSVQRQGDMLWLGTTTGQLLAYRDEKFVRQINRYSIGSGIFRLKTDQRGNMWFCQSPLSDPIIGLFMMRPNGSILEYDRDKGLEERILAVDQGSDGALYVSGIGTSSLLYQYSYEQDSFYNLSLPLEFEVGENFEVHDIEVDDSGNVLLATTDGLLRYDLERFTRVDLGPYTETEIRGIAAIDRGDYWIATDTYGLLHYDGDQFVLMDESAGLGSKISSYRCLTVDSKDKVWAGTAEGLVYSRTSEPRPDYTSQPILIEVSTEGRKVRVTRNGCYNLKDRVRSQIVVKSVEYPGKKVEYRYRMVDKFGKGEWISLGENSIINLNNPNRSIMAFEIAAMNHVGKSWSRNLVIPVQVIKPWYHRTWAYISFGLLVLSVIWTLFRLNFSKMMHRVRKLESALAISEQEYEKVRSEKIEDKHRLDFILGLTEILKDKSSEKEVIEAIGKNLDESFDLDLIEIGIYDPSNETIIYNGYDSSLNVITERDEPFEFKEQIGAYAMHHNETLLFREYVEQHKAFVSPEEDDHPYASQIIIPFELKDRRKAILHVAAEDANLFGQRDVEMFSILSTMVDSIDIQREK